MSPRRLLAVAFTWQIHAIISLPGDTASAVRGDFKDLDVVRLEWRTRPLKLDAWALGGWHDFSAKRAEKRLPRSSDGFRSSIYVTYKASELWEFRGLIQRCQGKTRTLALRRPKSRLLRWLLSLFMRPARDRQLECSFGPELTVRSLSKEGVEGELRRSCDVYTPFSFQEVLQRWHGRRSSWMPWKRCSSNDFARDSLLWCEDQPMHKVHQSVA